MPLEEFPKSVKNTVGIGDQRENYNYLDPSKNTLKSHGDLKRLVVT